MNSEEFCHRSSSRSRRNTLCISRVLLRRTGAKEPLCSSNHFRERTTNKEKEDIFRYPLDENQNSDDLIMIVSDLVKEYDEGSDGYALIVEKRPSLTPLNANMTFKELKDW